MCKQDWDRKDPQRKGEERGRSLLRSLCSEVGEKTEESADWTRDARGGSDTSIQPSPGTESQPGGDPVTLFRSLRLQGGQRTGALGRRPVLESGSRMNRGGFLGAPLKLQCGPGLGWPPGARRWHSSLPEVWPEPAGKSRTPEKG